MDRMSKLETCASGAQRRLRAAWVACATTLLVFAAASSAQAQLSEKISRSIAGAQRFESTRSFRDALAVYDKVLGDAGLALTGDDPANARLALRRRARLFEQINENEKAETDFSALVAMDAENNPGGLSDRGFFYMRRGRYVDATGDFSAAIRIDAEDASLRYAAGRAYTALGDLNRALKFYDEALRINPKFSRALLARAEAQVHVGRFEAAARDYDLAMSQGLSRRQDRFFVYLGRGYVNLRMDRYDAAVRDLDLALDLDRTSAHALAWRAHANELRGRKDLALDDYESVAPLLPDNNKVGASLNRLRSK